MKLQGHLYPKKLITDGSLTNFASLYIIDT
jgi:hypothetical protein